MKPIACSDHGKLLSVVWLNSMGYISEGPKTSDNYLIFKVFYPTVMCKHTSLDASESGPETEHPNSCWKVLYATSTVSCCAQV